MKKAAEGHTDEINTCIGCNQACLDHGFKALPVSCLVNPRAGNETELQYTPVADTQRRRVAVVGAGPAGLSCATVAAQRGHDVTLFEASPEVGGQFNLAKRVPGKDEFYETIRYFSRQIELTGVQLKLNTRAGVDDFNQGQFDHVVIATGVVPRHITFPGTPGETKVVSYADVLSGRETVGDRVAVIGAGGIGFDIAEFVTHVHAGHSTTVGLSNEEGVPDPYSRHKVEEFAEEWGIDMTLENRGGLLPPAPGGGGGDAGEKAVYLLQRKRGKLGAGLGKTTGWIHRATLKMRNVHMLRGVSYDEVTPAGLRVSTKHGEKTEERLLEVDTIVVCAGQESERGLESELKSLPDRDFTMHRIGGAELAAELDAKRAIDQGSRLAAQIESAEEGVVYMAPVPLSGKLMQAYTQRKMK